MPIKVVTGYLTLSGVARALGVSDRTVRRWHKAGLILPTMTQQNGLLDVGLYHRDYVAELRRKYRRGDLGAVDDA